MIVSFTSSIPRVSVQSGLRTSVRAFLISKVCAGSSEYKAAAENVFPSQKFVNNVAPYTDKVYVNEINTIPGSLSFYLWEKTNMSYRDLLDKLISLAFRRNRNRENLTFTIDTNILSGVSFGTKGAKGSKM